MTSAKTRRGGARVVGAQAPRASVLQIQVWLGHSDTGFTLRTCVHLIDDGLGDANFLDEAGWATRGATAATPKRANAEQPRTLKVAV